MIKTQNIGQAVLLTLQHNILNIIHMYIEKIIHRVYFSKQFLQQHCYKSYQQTGCEIRTLVIRNFDAIGL